MSRLDEYVDGLQQETLSEMAHSYFGARVQIDDETAYFHEMAKELHRRACLALGEAHLLHALLFDEDLALSLYASLGLDAKDILARSKDAPMAPLPAQPFALTRCGRYVRLVERVYAAAAASFHEYLHGAYVEDTRDKGRKRLSMHYHLLMQWLVELNRRIDEVNCNQSPSCVLSFAKGLNPDALERERIAGGAMPEYAASLDDCLRLPHVQCVETGLSALPELPAPSLAKKCLKAFAVKAYQAHGPRIEELVLRLREEALRAKD